MIRTRARVLAAAALVIGAAACEPSGPGALTATVRTPGPTGAVVVELVGRDLTGFEGVGDVRTFAADPQPADSIRRVIVMSPSAGPLQFKVQVPDVSAPPPAATVVDAVDASSRKLTTLTGFTVRIAR
jgi:hypothetical protein